MEEISRFLKERAEEGTLRKLRPAIVRRGGSIRFGSKEYIDFSSNDYLGLSSHPKLIEASRKALETYGTGSSGSRLLSGDLEIFHKLEERIAEFKGKEASLVFNSGYQNQMIAPGASSCTFGSSCSCSCVSFVSSLMFVLVRHLIIASNHGTFDVRY